jgi:PAS domain S-box-containing protein
MPSNHDTKIDSGDILIVDDETANLQLLTQLLSGAGYQPRAAKGPKVAIKSALAYPPALILLDVKMPEMDGYEVCKHLKQDERTRDIPILFISALHEMQDKIMGFEAGGVDFITKPFQEKEVLARVRTHMELRNMQLNLEEIVVERTVKLANEINERKQAEVKIRESEERFRYLVTNIPDVTWTSDRKGKTAFISSNILGIYGYSPDEIYRSGETLWFNRIHPDDVENVKRAFGSLFDTSGFRYDIEYRIRNKDGQWVWLHDRSIVTYKKGGVSYADGILTDVTVRKQAEESLSKSEARYRSLVDNSLVGVFNSNVNGQLIFVNGALAQIYDFDSPEQMMADGSLLRWVDPKKREQLISQLQDHGSVSNFEAETVTRNGRQVSILFSVKMQDEVIAGMVMDITERKQAELEVQKSYAEIERLKELLEEESAYLREEITVEHNYNNIIGNSRAIKYVLFKVEQVSASDANVLVLGETGTGKELFTRAIHDNSAREKRPIIKVNCAALPSHLIESELFGHERGSFTSAHSKHIGRFEVADGSTLFLDEIGELPLELQAKLLRVIEDGEFERLGGTNTIKVDVRIIAATNRDLKKEVKEGRFREDLWYRLNVFPITIPPLRDRIEDIPLIVQYYLDIFNKKQGKKITNIPVKTMRTLQNHNWPGNIRELVNIVERAVLTSPGSQLKLADALGEDDSPLHQETFLSLHEMERDYIFRVLEKTKWKVSGKNSAAEMLALDRSTLRRKMEKLKIQKP